jgi:hypothetical protein
MSLESRNGLKVPAKDDESKQSADEHPALHGRHLQLYALPAAALVAHEQHDLPLLNACLSESVRHASVSSVAADESLQVADVTRQLPDVVSHRGVRGR